MFWWHMLAARAIDARTSIRRWRPPISVSLIVLLAGCAVAPMYGCHRVKERDQWWVQRIAATSGRVTQIVKEGEIAIAKEDAQAIEEMEAINDQRAKDAAELAERRSKPVSDACSKCSVPAERLWLRE